MNPRRQAAEDRRRRIIEAFEARPGLSFRAVLRATGIPSGSASHHVRALLSDGRVWRLRDGRAMMLFAGAAPETAAEVQEVWRRVLDEVDLRVLEGSRGLPSLGEVVRRCPETKAGTVQYRLKRLVRRGFLAVFRDGRLVRYLHPDPGGKLVRTAVAEWSLAATAPEATWR